MSDQIIERLLKLDNTIESVEDTNQILDAFHRYVHYFSLLHIEGILSTFANSEDISLEVAEEGVVVGAAELRKQFSFMLKLAKRPGVLVYHYITCPVVEIAKDKKTAKLTCFAPGCDAKAQANVQNWIYGKYYVDFLKDEQGNWKIWHVRWFRTFETPMTVGWLVEQKAHEAEYTNPKLKDIYETSGKKLPSTYPENWEYPKHFDPNQFNYLMPEPPKSYDSWTGMTAMDKTRTY